MVAQMIDIQHERAGAFDKAMQSASPGEEIVYHRGKFAAGPHKHSALSAAEAGLCLIYQRRLEKGEFLYVARKRRASK